MYYVSRDGYKKMYENYLAYGEEIKRVNKEAGESAAEGIAKDVAELREDILH